MAQDYSEITADTADEIDPDDQASTSTDLATVSTDTATSTTTVDTTDPSDPEVSEPTDTREIRTDDGGGSGGSGDLATYQELSDVAESVGQPGASDSGSAENVDAALEDASDLPSDEQIKEDVTGPDGSVITETYTEALLNRRTNSTPNRGPDPDPAGPDTTERVAVGTSDDGIGSDGFNLTADASDAADDARGAINDALNVDVGLPDPESVIDDLEDAIPDWLLPVAGIAASTVIGAVLLWLLRPILKIGSNVSEAAT